MNQSHYYAVREAVIKAVPEILEHRCGGCKRKYAEYVNGCVFCWRDDLSREENQKLFPNRSVWPVAREIRLADVLLAIGENAENWRKNNWFTWVFPFADGLNGFAGFKGYSHKEGFAMLTNDARKPIGWNLRKDSLEDQSEELIEFLYNILAPSMNLS